MEFANDSAVSNGQNGQSGVLVRVATRGDTTAITRLLRQSTFRHVHVDWRLPVEWIGSPGFVVAEATKRPFSATLFGQENPLYGCLAGTADPPPAAWVRLVALAEEKYIPQVLAAMLEPVRAYLQETAVTQLAWLVMSDWPLDWLPQLGFHFYIDIETYVKPDLEIPPFTPNPQVHIRPVRETDMPQLAHLEQAAFEPLWRHSVEALMLARQYTCSFDVAIIEGEIVGFQFSTPGHSSAHLVRLTVDPAWHGHGVGSTLLAHTLANYRHQGFKRATLNTQTNNYTSQRLYRRFGFQASGQKLPIWVLAL
ncbi:MAG: GNAT family N-acetyltransferase [Chloroflexi bacterium]|nr:MAG: GNAT family N-acetyltransferase [Chloroflexota bacterium]